MISFYKHRYVTIAVFLLVIVVTTSLIKRGYYKDNPDPDPEKELASFHVADGFEITLFAAADPIVVKPIQMNWDAAGRLWVVTSTAYPPHQNRCNR